MRKAVPILACFAVLLSSCASTTEITWPTYTEDDTGSIVQMNVGDQFIVDLRDPGDGGYVFDEPIFEADHLAMIDSTETEVGLTEDTQQPALGDFGRGTWTFKALEKGATDIVITATRPWDEKDYVIMFEATFEVE